MFYICRNIQLTTTTHLPRTQVVSPLLPLPLPPSLPSSSPPLPSPQLPPTGQTDGGIDDALLAVLVAAQQQSLIQDQSYTMRQTLPAALGAGATEPPRAHAISRGRKISSCLIIKPTYIYEIYTLCTHNTQPRSSSQCC